MQPPLRSLAFAPAVISNFFVIHDEALHREPPDLSLVGATGGGFTLSKGVYTSARVVPSSSTAVSVAVNGDANYVAKTTRKAVELLLEAAHQPPQLVELVQTTEVPIGLGFGTSSASALSAVMAVASALELNFDKEKVAYFAHAADVLLGTGLGTVSSTYDHSGAGLIVRAGGPGVARVRQVKVPTGTRVITASLEPIPKGTLLSSPRRRKRVNSLGELALEQASDLKFKSLLAAGHAFAERLGLTTRQVRRLIEVSMKSGAIGASQNMIGNAMHAIVREDKAERVKSALLSASNEAAVDSFRIGGRTARVLTS
jgi:pantoate kinase